jgi:uncharacterized protein YndB with AHSA1/START domain
MKDYREIKQSVNIDASPNDVWSVFVNPALTRQLGGQYETDWIPGSRFRWIDLQGNAQAEGTVVRCIPEKLLELQYHDISHTDDILNNITYELMATRPAFTTLAISETIHYPVSDEDYTASENAWKDILSAIADIAEKIAMQ